LSRGSNTLRRNVFEAELVESLALADRSVLAEIFKSEAIPAGERLHPENVVALLRARGLESAVYADADAIVARLLQSCARATWWRSVRTAGSADLREAAEGDCEAALTNGGSKCRFDGVGDAVVAVWRGRWLQLCARARALRSSGALSMRTARPRLEHRDVVPVVADGEDLCGDDVRAAARAAEPRPWSSRREECR